MLTKRRNPPPSHFNTLKDAILNYTALNASKLATPRYYRDHKKLIFLLVLFIRIANSVY